MNGPAQRRPGVVEDITAGNLLVQKAAIRRDRLLFAPRGAILLRQGAAEKACLIVLCTGWAVRMRNMARGKRALISIYLPGDLIGADSLFYAPGADEVVALTDASYGVVDRPAVHKLMQQRAAWVSVMYQMVAERCRTDEWAFGLACGNAVARLAGFILGLHERLRRKQIVSGNSFHLPLTQEQIADHLGLTAVHVNRVARALREKAILVIRDRTALISDMPRLRQLAMAPASVRLAVGVTLPVPGE